MGQELREFCVNATTKRKCALKIRNNKKKK